MDVTMRKIHITITPHQEDKQNKATSFLFLLKTILNLERKQSNVQQNVEQTQNSIMRAPINNESAAVELSVA